MTGRGVRLGEHAVLVVLGLAGGLGLNGGLRPWSGPLFVALVAASALLGRFRPARGRVALTALLPGAVLLVAAATVDVWEAVSALVVAGLVVALPWSLARARCQQHELLAAERARTEALLAERAAVADRARLAERSRLATDIHHTLGHELALLGVRAGALEVAGDPTQRQAAAALRASAVTATDHLRRALDLLGPDPALEPAAVGVAEVVARAQRAGLDVALEPEVVPPLPEALTALAEHAVREGITNAARHAPGAPVRINVEGPELVLQVRDPGTGTSGGAGDSAGVSTAGSGSGLAGLREHASALGGRITAGPTGEAGGWLLEVRVPDPGPDR